MPRKTAHDFDQELLTLFDAYVHGDLDRRGFLDRAAKFAVGGVTAAMLLEALQPRFAEAQRIPPDDSRLTVLARRERPTPPGGSSLAATPYHPSADSPRKEMHR